MTYHTLVQQLNEIGSSDPSGEAILLIASLLGRSREWCLLNRHTELPDEINKALIRRQSGEPLQYIIGEAWFYGYMFTVSPDCLIPQPDTEHAVMLALQHLRERNSLLDLCTGSGCIAISILKENASAHAVAVDISPKALDVARSNAAYHHVDNRLRLLEQDVMDTATMPQLITQADVIVSNPPYINSDVIDSLPSEVQHEPRIALDGGDDGMDFYRRFILDYAPLMKLEAVMILEIGYDQSERILALCESAQLSCRLHKDYGGNIRVAEISRSNSFTKE